MDTPVTVLCFSILATSISSSCSDNVCWNDPLQNVWRHECKTGANGGPYELAEQLLVGLQQPVPVVSAFRGGTSAVLYPVFLLMAINFFDFYLFLTFSFSLILFFVFLRSY